VFNMPHAHKEGIRAGIEDPGNTGCFITVVFCVCRVQY